MPVLQKALKSLCFLKLTEGKHVPFPQEAVHTAVHVRDADLPDGDTCTVNTGDRALSPSDWQASGLVATSPGHRVRKQSPQQIPWREREKPLLWESSVQDPSEFHRRTPPPGSAHPRRLLHKNSCTILQRCIFDTTHQSTNKIARNWKKH